MYSRIKRTRNEKGVFMPLLSRAARYAPPIVIFTNPIPFYKYLYRLLYVARKYIISPRVETRTLQLSSRLSLHPPP